MLCEAFRGKTRWKTKEKWIDEVIERLVSPKEHMLGKWGCRRQRGKAACLWVRGWIGVGVRSVGE